MPLFARVRRVFQEKWFPLVVSGLCMTTVMVLLFVTQPPLLRQLDLKVYDMLLPLRQQEAISPVPVVIDIDEDSLAEYGQWPWPRYLLARLLTELTAQGAAAVGVDILLAEADRSSPEQMRASLQRDAGLTVGFTGLPDTLLDYDALLAEALKGQPIVLGGYARFDEAWQPGVPLPAPVGFVTRSRAGGVDFEGRVLTAKSATLPLPSLWQNADVGFINMAPDMDGITRQVPLIIQLDNAMYPSLALRTLMRAMGVKNIMAQAGADGLESLGIGPLVVPVSPGGSFLVPFQGPSKTYPYISAREVLQGKLPPGFLQGKIAFVGTSAPGLLDIRATPLDRLFPGAEVHAAVLDSILSANFLQEPVWGPGAQVMGIVLCGFLTTCAFGFARPRIYILVGIVLLGATLYGSRYLFLRGLFVSPLYMALTITLQGSLLLFLRFWQEEQQKIFLRKAFSRYVAPEVVRRIADLRGNIFSGEERELTIMFTDIRRFTAISETLSPQQVVLLLNRYFTLMTGLVRKENGTLDKFIGDALMAFWNAPVEVPDHPVHAVSAALAMQEQLERLNAELEADFGICIAMGVGIHTGKAYVGNMGSAELINYTLIGDAVNLTSRLEGVCATYNVGIAVSSETAERCGDRFAFQHLDTVRVKGKQQPVTVYIPMRHEEKERRRDELRMWETAQAYYTAGKFSLAAQEFRLLNHSFPHTAPYALFAERARLLMQDPPEHWDGIWELNT